MDLSLIGMVVITAFICANTYWVFYCTKSSSTMKSLIKTCSVGLLALAAFLLDTPVALIVALGFGALGDLLLSRDKEAAFLGGVGAFAIAHLAYAWLMINTGEAVLSFIWPVAILLVLGALMAVILFRFAGALRWPVIGYVAVILTMGVVAFGLPQSYFLGLVAALMFIASDTILAFELFILPVNHKAHNITPYAVWGLYWGAQCLFLVAFALLWIT